MDHIGRDLRHAVRAIRRMPVLASVVVISLGVGIGANTVVFSFLQSRVLRPLPGVDDAGSVQLIEPRAETGSYPGASWLEYRDLRERVRAFEEIFAFRIQALTVGEAARAERTSGLLVSGNYFHALRMRPALGRLIEPEDTRRPGGEPVAVLAHDYWQTHFAGAADVVGRNIRVNGTTLTIIGVTPSGFEGTVIGMRFDIWVPATLAPLLMNGSRELEERSVRGYQLAGRLAAGASVPQAETELEGAMRELARVHPETNQGLTGEVLPFWQSPRGPQRMLVRSLAVLQGIMLVLWLAVCGNTATLLLARAGSRQHEVSVRLAMGARSSGVARLFMIETLLLALVAAAVGVAVALWVTPAVSAIPLSSGFPVRTRAVIDLGGLTFAVALAVLSALVFGAAPAVQLARVDPCRALHHGTRATSRGWLRKTAMGVQVALALVVLIAAGLFFRSLRETRDIDPGFRREGVLVARYDLTARSVTPSSSRDFANRVLDAMRALPGVDAAAVAQQVPLDIHGLPLVSFTLEGRARTDGAVDRALSNVVTPGYFDTMGIPILAGSDFVELDNRSAERQVVVNQAFVDGYLTGGAVLGRALDVAGRRYVVTAVVRNSVSEAFGEPPMPCMYFSYRDRPAPVGQLHVRTRSGAEGQQAAALRKVVSDIDAALSLYDIRTLSDHVETNLGLRKIPARMFMVIGPLLLLLAATGIYAVVAYAVTQRRTEIGVRLALGATVRRVSYEVVRDHMRFVGVGAAAGWGLAYAAYVRVVREPLDIAVFVGVPLLLLILSAVASWVPARRVSRVDPGIVLRDQ
jgi:predicted permease